MADAVANIGTGATTGAIAGTVVPGVGNVVGGVVGAAIGAGVSIMQSIFASRAQDRANRAIQQSLEKASGTLKGEFAKTEQGYKPYTQGGAQAFTDVANKQASGYYDEQFDMAKFNQDPGVAFRMQEANNALERSSSARGRTLSGGTLRSLADLNQSLASQEYGAAYKRYRGERAEHFDRGMKLGEFGFRGESQLGQHRETLGSKLADLQTTGGSSTARRNLNQGQIYSDLTAQLGQQAGNINDSVPWNKLFKSKKGTSLDLGYEPDAIVDDGTRNS